MNGFRYWFDRYIAGHPMTRKAARSLERSILKLIEWLGSDIPIADADERKLSDWLAKLDGTCSPHTLKNHRANVLAILKYAADFDARPEPRVRLVRRVAVPPLDPKAWTAGEFSALISAVEQMKRRCRPRPKITEGQYLLAIISTGYDTGARLGDLMKIDHDWIDGDGRLRFSISKTKTGHVAQLSDLSITCLRSIPYRRPLWWGGKWAEYYTLWRNACKRAGIRYGATQMVRRTAATIVWRDDPATVQRFLGHRTPDMWKHYVDQIQAATPIRPRQFWREGSKA